MAEALVPASIPLLSPDVTVQALPGGDLSVETADTEYTFHGEGGRALAAVADRLDGSASIADLASPAEVSPESLARVLDSLVEDGLVMDARRLLQPSSVEEFLAAYHQACGLWAKEMSLGPFWSTLASGRAPRAMVLGWGVEFYHYVEAANEHMAASVAYCRGDPGARRWFAQHYAEEYNHSIIFLEGLVACGLDRDQVRRAPPLSTTRALLNHLVELATTDSLAYAGAFGLMRDSRAVRDDQRVRYEQLIEHYPFARGMFEAIQKHNNLDQGLKHDELVLERIVQRDGRVTPEAARRIAGGARSTLEHFVLYFEGIHDAYVAPGAVLPRRAVDVRALAR